MLLRMFMLVFQKVQANMLHNIWSDRLPKSNVVLCLYRASLDQRDFVEILENSIPYDFSYIEGIWTKD
jgi:hypothetical protein